MASISKLSSNAYLHVGITRYYYTSNKMPRSLDGVTDAADYLLPFYLNSEGGEEGFNKTQCLCAGANNWIPTQQIFQAGLENGGATDQWAIVDTPQAWGYFKREDIPYHFALAESYALADHYHVCISATAMQLENINIFLRPPLPQTLIQTDGSGSQARLEFLGGHSRPIPVVLSSTTSKRTVSLLYQLVSTSTKANSNI